MNASNVENSDWQRPHLCISSSKKAQTQVLSVCDSFTCLCCKPAPGCCKVSPGWTSNVDNWYSEQANKLMLLMVASNIWRWRKLGPQPIVNKLFSSALDAVRTYLRLPEWFEWWSSRCRSSFAPAHFLPYDYFLHSCRLNPPSLSQRCKREENMADLRPRSHNNKGRVRTSSRGQKQVFFPQNS